jgi:DNA-binding NarL/FixJ family response regulator
VTVRVLLADDHAILRQALHTLLEREGFEVVAEACDGPEAVAAARDTAPDVAVLDVLMPGLNGVDAARAIKRANPATHVILLTGVDDSRYVPEAMSAGVRGFVLKSQGADDLIRAIREVCRGVVYVSPAMSSAVLEHWIADTRGRSGPRRLTPREREVVQLVAEGKSTKEIAAQLQISVKTAEFHRSRIMAKLEIHDVAGLVRYAIRQGLIAP